MASICWAVETAVDELMWSPKPHDIKIFRFRFGGPQSGELNEPIEAGSHQNVSPEVELPCWVGQGVTLIELNHIVYRIALFMFSWTPLFSSLSGRLRDVSHPPFSNKLWF